MITHAHWDHFLGMNEFDATIIVNSETNERIKDWQSMSYDDHSLQKYVDTKQISPICMEVIQTGIPNRDNFKLRSPDVIFEDSLTIDLGNKLCNLDRINSTHTDDSTIIYIPDEKVIFLGDSGYGTTTNSLFHYKQSLLLPMMKDIQKYDAEMFLLGHESICDLDEINVYWEELTAASEVVKSTSLEDAIALFKTKHKRDPNENELFFIQALVNDYIIQSQ